MNYGTTKGKNYGLLPGEVGNYGESAYGGSYGGSSNLPQLGTEGVIGIKKIDPTKFGGASKRLFEQALGQDLRGLTPEQSMAQNPWVGLAQRNQQLQQGFSRDAANRAPLSGVEGFRQQTRGIAPSMVTEIAKRADIGQGAAAQNRSDLGKASSIENIAFALAGKKKAGEELSKVYAEQEAQAREQAGRGFFQNLFGL